jgi:hypothetical protein
MWRRIWMQVASVLLLAGCTAASTMVGVREPDPTRIKADDQRSQVEKTLGERLWRAGSADGVTYDIYQYEAARPADPGHGAAHILGDILTLGATAAQRADAKALSAPFKQVAVAYDERDRVRFVSRPWSVGSPEPCRRMRSLLPVDSGVPSNARPSPLAERTGSASGSTTLTWSWGNRGLVKAIDGHKPEERVVELRPGLHKVELAAYLNKEVVDVELLPGRRYRVNAESFIPGGGTGLDVTWIEDVESEEVLACVSGVSHTES